MAIAAVSIPAGTAAGKVVYKRPTSPVVCFPGDQIVAEVTTAAATSGGAIYGFSAHLDPETPANQGDMILSA
ncbi:MAG: hypothetical protein HC842_04120 [Cytophagales bacterium]|nr:hypothetical protein [Cytophagales bacterium]